MMDRSEIVQLLGDQAYAATSRRAARHPTTRPGWRPMTNGSTTKDGRGNKFGRRVVRRRNEVLVSDVVSNSFAF